METDRTWVLVMRNRALLSQAEGARAAHRLVREEVAATMLLGQVCRLRWMLWRKWWLIDYGLCRPPPTRSRRELT